MSKTKVVVLTIRKHVHGGVVFWDVYRNGWWEGIGHGSLTEARKRVAEIIEEIKEENQ